MVGRLFGSNGVAPGDKEKGTSLKRTLFFVVEVGYMMPGMKCFRDGEVLVISSFLAGFDLSQSPRANPERQRS